MQLQLIRFYRTIKRILNKRKNQSPHHAVIKVISVGGCGCNFINHMNKRSIKGVEFIAVNTDSQALAAIKVRKKLVIGWKTLKGIGAGGNVESGFQAAVESSVDLDKVLKGADIVFIIAGMGGGTGSGAASVIAQIAKEAGALTIGMVTLPFTYEGTRRFTAADEGTSKLKDRADAVILLPNDRIFRTLNNTSSFQTGLLLAEDYIFQGIKAISEVINAPGLINLDLAHLRVILCEGGGVAMIGTSSASGENCYRIAAEQAVSSHLVDVTIDGAHGILANIIGGPDMTTLDVNQAIQIIKEMARPDANIFIGVTVDQKLEEEARIMVIATGLGSQWKLHDMDSFFRPIFEIPDFLRRHAEETQMNKKHKRKDHKQKKQQAMLELRQPTPVRVRVSAHSDLVDKDRERNIP